jgi:lysophospholipase L1-like esterase
MKTFLCSCLALLLLSFVPPKQNPVSVFLIGDSTMAEKAADKFPETGWGMKLQPFFAENVVIKNHAVNGRSTKSFIAEGRWKKVLDELKKGDYVFIQFGHNDQKVTDSTRYTNPYTAYRTNLIRYVTESRSKGAIPVLLTPVVRRDFNEQGTLLDTHGAYPEVMRTVAKELKVQLIDLQLKTEEMVISYGPEKSKELYLWVEPGDKNYPDGKQDNTHFCPKGAETVALIVANEIRRLGIMPEKILK